MLLRGLFGLADSFESRSLWNIDSGANGGGQSKDDSDASDSDDGGDGDDSSPKYSQRDFEKAIQARLKSAKRDAKLKDQEVTKLQAQVADLEKKIGELSSSDSDKDKDKDSAGKLELLKQRYERDLATLRDEVTAANKKAEAAEMRQRQVERDTLLTNALSEAKCIDLDGGRRYFLPQVEWDEVDAQWMFRTKSGNLVEIEEGVVAELPNYLKPSSLNGGGSGTPTGSGRKAVVLRELDTAKKTLDAAKDKFRKNPNDTKALFDYKAAQKAVKSLEQTVANTK